MRIFTSWKLVEAESEGKGCAEGAGVAAHSVCTLSACLNSSGLNSHTLDTAESALLQDESAYVVPRAQAPRAHIPHTSHIGTHAQMVSGGGNFESSLGLNEVTGWVT